MSSKSLVAKRSLRSIVITPRRIPIAKRNARTFRSSNAIQHPRSKFKTERTQPLITPAARREQLSRAESLEGAKTNNESKGDRGRLLKLSTLKPTNTASVRKQEPDPIPVNCIDTTKRIVRIIKSSGGPTSLDVEVRPKTVSIGIQVGKPSPQLARKQPTVFAPAPKPLPPLRSYWTHKINLPYPPDQSPNQLQVNQAPDAQGNQFMQSSVVHPQQVSQIPIQQANHFMPQPQYFLPYEPVYQPPVQAPTYRAPFYQRPSLSRKQRRNNIKRERYLQRHM